MHQITALVRGELEAVADEEVRVDAQRFSKEKIKLHGVKTGRVHEIADRYWSQVEVLSKEDVFGVCEELFSSGYVEEAFVASFWLPKMAERLEPSDLAVFKVWIERYVDNWLKCDTFCNHTVGGLVERYPESVTRVKSWAKSSNRWLKRAAAVSLIIPAKKGLFLQEAFEICDMLLSVEDDMVQKGYGWLLKEESIRHQKEVFAYVLKNRKTMPRTALRYAIERMPKELRQEAMRKD